jgi:hypothetical protein
VVHGVTAATRTFAGCDTELDAALGKALRHQSVFSLHRSVESGAKKIRFIEHMWCSVRCLNQRRWIEVVDPGEDV